MYKKLIFIGKDFSTAFLILLQRTELQKKHSLFVIKLNGIFKGVFIIPFIFKQSVSFRKVFQLYENTVREESDLISNLIKKNFQDKEINILDIGCGIGGYHKKWMSERTGFTDNLFLMDSSNFDLSALRYGHGKVNRYYNSISLAVNYLTNKKVTTVIKPMEISKNLPYVLPDSLDLVVSFISWGFHYPLNTYWDSIMNNLNNETGIIVIDVRKNSESYRFLENSALIKLEIIQSNNKYDRVMVRKLKK